MNFKQNGFNVGKTVYFIGGQSFENDNGSRNGKEKAAKYALDNFLNPNNILKFDSRLERDRYVYLSSLQDKGEITHLAHHFLLLVQSEFINANGDQIPEITYESDFIYLENGKRVVEDVKGSTYFINQDFLVLKKVFDKLMHDKGLYIRTIIRDGNEWVEWRIGEKKKSTKMTDKLRAENKKMKEEIHQKNLLENQKRRDLERLKVLNNLQKLTKTQEKRKLELEKKYGIS